MKITTYAIYVDGSKLRLTDDMSDQLKGAYIRDCNYIKVEYTGTKEEIFEKFPELNFQNGSKTL